MAGSWCVEGEFERAAKLLGAASALALTTNRVPGRALLQSTSLDDDLNAIRDALGEEAFTAAWDAGRALSLEAAVQAALSSASPYQLAPSAVERQRP